MTTVEANISNSTSVVMTTVGGNEYAIGYISLGSLNDTVKAVQIEGVDATVENIKNGSYAVSRPFNIATKEGLSEVAADFVAYIMSAEGQAIVAENGYITVADDAAAYAGSAPAGNVVVAGSSSVTPSVCGGVRPNRRIPVSTEKFSGRHAVKSMAPPFFQEKQTEYRKRQRSNAVPRFF